MAETLTALVVGCGSIGTRHAKNLKSLGVDVSLFDVDNERSRALGNELNSTLHTSLDDGLDQNPDIVVIATPTNHHIAPAIASAERACDLFVEKPISNTSDGVEELLEVVESNDLVTMIGCNLRFHPAIRSIYELIDEGTIGKIISARIAGGSSLPEWHPDEDYRKMYSAKAGVGGALLDYIHELNYARWLFGEPTVVSGMLGFQGPLEIETEDTASVLVRFDSGVISNIHLDYVHQPYSRSCHVIGENGTIRWQWEDSAVHRYVPDEASWRTECRFPDWNMNDMYEKMMRHFIDCVRTRSETTSSLADGWRDLQFVMAAKESHEADSHIQL